MLVTIYHNLNAKDFIEDLTHISQWQQIRCQSPNFIFGQKNNKINFSVALHFVSSPRIYDDKGLGLVVNLLISLARSFCLIFNLKLYLLYLIFEPTFCLIFFC